MSARSRSGSPHDDLHRTSYSYSCAHMPNDFSGGGSGDRSNDLVPYVHRLCYDPPMRMSGVYVKVQSSVYLPCAATIIGSPACLKQDESDGDTEVSFTIAYAYCYSALQSRPVHVANRVHALIAIAALCLRRTVYTIQARSLLTLVT